MFSCGHLLCWSCVLSWIGWPTPQKTLFWAELGSGKFTCLTCAVVGSVHVRKLNGTCARYDLTQLGSSKIVRLVTDAMSHMVWSWRCNNVTFAVQNARFDKTSSFGFHALYEVKLVGHSGLYSSADYGCQVWILPKYLRKQERDRFTSKLARASLKAQEQGKKRSNHEALLDEPLPEEEIESAPDTSERKRRRVVEPDMFSPSDCKDVAFKVEAPGAQDGKDDKEALILSADDAPNGDSWHDTQRMGSMISSLHGGGSPRGYDNNTFEEIRDRNMTAKACTGILLSLEQRRIEQLNNEKFICMVIQGKQSLNSTPCPRDAQILEKIYYHRMTAAKAAELATFLKQPHMSSENNDITNSPIHQLTNSPIH